MLILVAADPPVVVTSPVKAGKVETGMVVKASTLPVPVAERPSTIPDETVCILAKVTLLFPISGTVAEPDKSPAN